MVVPHGKARASGESPHGKHGDALSHGAIECRFCGAQGRMRARCLDANHGDVRDHLRAIGWSVLDLATHGMSVDVAVGKPHYAALVEIKDGTKPPSKRELTEDEKRLRDNWTGPYFLVTSCEDAESQLEAAYRAARG